MSAAMAARAASFISLGAAKSGKPCARFTALNRIASRVISRITDSVNKPARSDSGFRTPCDRSAALGLVEGVLLETGVVIGLRREEILVDVKSVFRAVNVR